MRLRDLEIELQQMNRHTEHEVSLESYPTPAPIAAAILFAAEMEHSDIHDKTVLDLGCGDGIFALGAALLGARCVLGIDLQSKALKAARENSTRLGIHDKVDLVLGDVSSLELLGTVDTVMSNPPFGVKNRGADLRFLKKAISVARVTYSIHLAGDKNRAFLEHKIEALGGNVTQIETFQFPIAKIYEFHRKMKHLTKVDLYRIESVKVNG